MHIKKLATYLIAVLLLGAMQGGKAALTIEITQGVDGALPIAVVPFDTSRLSSKLPVDIAEIVASDLNISGVLKAMDRAALPANPHYSNQVQYPRWRSAGQDYLVVGRVLEESPGVYNIEFQLLDVLKQKQLLGRSMPAKIRNLRSRAHQISDFIYEQITGTRGAFNTRIAYVRAQKDAARKYVLQVADTDGYNAQNVLESDEPIMSPSWSPDGKSLAYVSFESKRPEIFIQHLATARRSKVSGFRGLNGAPSWSPDGKFLALVLSKDGNPDIYTLNTATKRLKRITSHRSIDTEPVWTADGNSIIFTSDRSGSPQLYEVGVDGGRPKRLTFEGRYNSAANISPDGKYIAMVHGARGQYKIAQIERETGNLTVLTDSALDESPSFSPNGRMVLYASGDTGSLFAVSFDGRARHKLSDQAGDIREPVWGPFDSK
ncbi:MAG: Tol-Pal system beta propeller repeat protein TolB [Gammaproteobacteria bacterium]|nr:Tol-Pal system beta propeller repeat protein TolB [Gammaproteobacteria bacterium]MDH3448728.1 Tol-Pal system beta propeller repeat protein TolB [Gammaproteobacteria bacterium]